jgi:hypothetical protein
MSEQQSKNDGREFWKGAVKLAFLGALAVAGWNLLTD